MAVVALDFDGVLHMAPGGPFTPDVDRMGPPVPGALQAVSRMVNEGHELVVHTCRARSVEGVRSTYRWLALHRFPPMRVTYSKPVADIYVDDRGFHFEGPGSWKELLGILEAGTPGRWGSRQ